MSCGTRARQFGPGDPDGAQTLRSFLWFVLLMMPINRWPLPAPPSGSRPPRPSCFCSGLEPRCRISRYARPQPAPLPRYRSLHFAAEHCEPHLSSCCRTASNPAAGTWWPLIPRATRSGGQSRHRRTTSLASELHHRTVLRTAPCVYCCPAVLVCRALLISATTETITASPSNVYSGRHRFLRVRRRGNRSRPGRKGEAGERGTGPEPAHPAVQRHRDELVHRLRSHADA